MYTFFNFWRGFSGPKKVFRTPFILSWYLHRWYTHSTLGLNLGKGGRGVGRTNLQNSEQRKRGEMAEGWNVATTQQPGHKNWFILEKDNLLILRNTLLKITPKNPPDLLFDQSLLAKNIRVRIRSCVAPRSRQEPTFFLAGAGANL